MLAVNYLLTRDMWKHSPSSCWNYIGFFSFSLQFSSHDNMVLMVGWVEKLQPLGEGLEREPALA